MIGSNGANRHPYAAPGTNTLLWRNKEELEAIINFATLDPQHKNTLTEILANELANIPPYLEIFIR